MRKAIILIILSLLVLNTFSVGAVEIKDVSTGHWAFQNITELINKGLFSLYEDGTFRGQDKVSRYELAEVVGRMLESIESGGAQAIPPDLSRDLAILSNNLREELVMLTEERVSLNKKIQELEEKNKSQDKYMIEAIDVEIAKLNEDLSNVENDVSTIINSIIKVTQLEQQIQKLDHSFQSLEEKVIQNQARISAQHQQLDSIRLNLSDSVVQGLEDKQTIVLTRVNQLQEEVNELRNLVTTRDHEIEKLKQEKGNYQSYIYGIGAIAVLGLLLSLGGS